MRIAQSDSAIVLADAQETCLATVDEAKQWLHNCIWVLRLAKYLNIPALVTRQAPEEYGQIVPALQNYLPDHHTVLTKTTLSCWQDSACQSVIKHLQRRQLIIFGTYTEGTILNSALDLIHHGYQVFVLAEACGSTRSEDKQAALKQLRNNGVEVVCGEMLLFEWSSGMNNSKQWLHAFLRDIA